MTEKSYNVPEVHCDHCIAAINRELGKIEGVDDIEVDLDAKTVKVKMDERVTDGQIVEGLYEAGFDVAAS